MGQKKITTTVYITEDQNNMLKELNRRTRVPIAEFIREGIDLVLEKNAEHLPGQLDWLKTSEAPSLPNLQHARVVSTRIEPQTSPKTSKSKSKKGKG